MIDDLSQFHWLRADWLLVILPWLILIVSLRHFSRKNSSWQKVVSPHLLKFLIQSNQKQSSQASFWLIGLIGLLIIIALSGPSFRQKPVPAFQTESARVILLDLSLSMEATDIKPSRLVRARHKVRDLLQKSNEGSIGLVVYAGDAFIISPLTSDANTIAAMVPTLSTAIMPVLGSRPDLAMVKAVELLKNAHKPDGQIIWITDGMEAEYLDSILATLSSSQAKLSILAVGTEQGAPIPLPNDNGFLKDSSGNIIIPKLQSAALKQIAQHTKGQYIELTADNQDIDLIMQLLELSESAASDKSQEKVSRWIDDGYWLSWPILLLFAFYLLSRKQRALLNTLATITPFLVASLLLSSLFSPNSEANIWNDLWQTKDQQAQQAFSAKEYATAAKLFKNKPWKAVSDYKNGDYNAAIELLSKASDIESTYNYANSLAKANQLAKAIEIYRKVLQQNPSHKDAEFNKQLVEDLLKQQQQKKQQEQKNKQAQDQKNQQKKDQKSDDSNQGSDNKDKQSEQHNTDKEKNNEQNESTKSKQQQEQEQERQQAKLAEDQRNKSEKDQALEHWLDKIPDDPGGLLRRKMIREYQRRGRTQKEKKLW